MISTYSISTDKSKLDIETIHDYLCNQSYWAQGRTIEEVKISIENSTCFGVYDKNENLVGFARVITDVSVLAWLLDVFILEEHRKQGLGKLLVKTVVEHPDFSLVNKWMLATDDAHTLYEKFGFKTDTDPQQYMRKVL